MSKKPLEIDMVAGSQLRDSQGEMLSVEGADIDELIAGRGRFNDNHGVGHFNCIGRVTGAKKIFKPEDCDTERQTYYWEKIKAPYIYVKGELYNDEDHPNAKAAAAIIRNIHKNDTPLKMKASIEGGVISRGISDNTLLARTKVHSVALTFTPANQATLVEPISLEKNMTQADQDADMELIKSVQHLAMRDIPSFRHIERRSSAIKIENNLKTIESLAKQLGLTVNIPKISASTMTDNGLKSKIQSNVKKIQTLTKALCAGYGGSGPVTGLTGGGVLQPEALKAESKKIKKEDIIEFFIKNPKATDKDIHTWADDNKVSPHDLEGTIYSTISMLVNLKGSDLPDSHFNKEQLAMGIKVEQEHIDCPIIAKAIAKAHLKEIPDYYTRLDRMENAKSVKESLNKSEKLQKKEFEYIQCNNCGKEQIVMHHQVKCRQCHASFPLYKMKQLAQFS